MGRACGRLLRGTAGPAGTCPWAQGGLVGVCGGAGHQGVSSSWRISVPLGPVQALLSFLSVYPALPSAPSPLLCPLTQPLVPGPCRATHLCPHLCSGPRSARRCGGRGLCASGGAAGSPRAVPSPGSSRPGAGPWGPARRPSASWGWCLRWSGVGGNRPAGWGQWPGRSSPSLPHPPSVMGCDHPGWDLVGGALSLRLQDSSVPSPAPPGFLQEAPFSPPPAGTGRSAEGQSFSHPEYKPGSPGQPGLLSKASEEPQPLLAARPIGPGPGTQHTVLLGQLGLDFPAHLSPASMGSL